MKKNDKGEYIFCERYIARKEEFQKAITEFNSLPVIGGYPDGDILINQLGQNKLFIP